MTAWGNHQNGRIPMQHLGAICDLVAFVRDDHE